jgi:hypothetical protein
MCQLQKEPQETGALLTSWPVQPNRGLQYRNVPSLPAGPGSFLQVSMGLTCPSAPIPGLLGTDKRIWSQAGSLPETTALSLQAEDP